ncbi:putative magnesium transporter NIPA6 [Citrus sinensis]|nr:putative magnesium transporter NIPA6 [Citrus sinensis]
MGLSENSKGLILAVASSAFIGSSFILKKKGLKRAGASGTRAGVGGYTYLLEPLWWAGMVTNFLIYVAATVSVVLALVLHFEPRCGQTNILVYLGICSLMGSLTVVSIKAIGIAIKLTLDGISQIAYPQTWFFLTVAAVCVITQLNYLNKALDTFNAAIVSPVYYVMFTTLTIIASAIMFKDWSGQDVSGIASEICGFITVLSGTIILHATREHEQTTAPGRTSNHDTQFRLLCAMRVSLKMDLKNEDDPPLFEQHCCRANKSWRSEEPLVFLDNADFNSER